MRKIDLRSDTVTLPTPQMREAMARAEVGDDVMGEDPTINRLEAMAAERMNKPAALFVASGTMGNLVAFLTHCRRGDEVIAGDQAHTFVNEVGGMAALGGIQPRTVPNQPDGTLRLEDIRNAIRGDNVHWPRTRLITLENTHNNCNGSPLGPEYLKAVYDIAQANGVAVHTDGARIFNAAIALGLPAVELTRYTDTISFCLSKGLSAPVGSLLCGPREFIAEARRQRKMVGGGMRQAGVLAAAGVVALETMIDRLAEDHANARRLADGIAGLPGIELNPTAIKTNIVFFGLRPTAPKAAQLAASLADQGILINPSGACRMRAVTHYGIERADIDAAVAAIRSAVRALGSPPAA
ncbi:MAG: low-specificity L-threonine aldolase [Chloroflexi bacterium]|nr:low-specificity L-threonine aldolase [Chloroflexota bacterium]